MSDAQDVEAVLSKLQASPTTRSAKWARVEASLGPIFAARDRGASWQAIAEALREVGIDVHHESLRLFVRAHPRDLKMYPRTTAGPPKRRRLNKPSKASKTVTTIESVANDEQLESELKGQPSDGVPRPAETTAAQKLRTTSKPSEFAGIRRLNARK